MTLPPGFSRKGEQRVCRLNQSLYGLKKASRNWFAKFTTALQDAGFQQENISLLPFMGLLPLLFLFMLMTSSLPAIIQLPLLLSFLHSLFQIKDLGPLKSFLGI